MYGIIYALYDSKGLRYIGQTIGRLQDRVSRHLAQKTRDRRGRWLAGLVARGERPAARIIQYAPDRPTLDALEVAYIENARLSGHPLVNMHPGGTGAGPGNHIRKGIPHTAEVKARISASMRKQVQNPETRAKRIASLTGRPSPLKGRKRPPEIGAKISAALMGHADFRDPNYRPKKR